jgi:hypothetical protein
MFRRRLCRRRVCLGAAVLALSWPLAGCVTVHGERADVPSVRPSEAARVLASFAAADNAAARSYDPAPIARSEAGALGAIDGAGVRAKHANQPAGDPAYTPLVFSATRFLIPRQRGWPKFFVADTATDRGPQRWLLVFRRTAPGLPWTADYLAVYAPGTLPALATGRDGYAEAVPLAGTGLLVQPGQLGAAYTAYLHGARGTAFAPGVATSQLRADRARSARTPDSVTQYADQPAAGGDFDPVGLRTADGGALVFFATRHQARSTFRAGYRLAIDPDTRALMTGTPRTSVTLSRVAQEAATVPRGGGRGRGRVAFVSRLVGLVAAKGE